MNASGVSEGGQKRALLLHLVSQDAQDIFETFTDTEILMTMLSQNLMIIFCQRKMMLLRDIYFASANKIQANLLTLM